MTDKIVVGSTVVLKSGGPLMTVSAIVEMGGIQSAKTDWFDSKNEPQKAIYPLTSLEPAEE
ncbi:MULTISPECIES: DUF2158 domain-containing protein [unclassified Phyllobacterium]|uniref:DUF2158 domain-containing protein n=1 Tax=unclassified Phyllobacterium TaxID=2638441 RepID=UPI003012E85D